MKNYFIKRIRATMILLFFILNTFILSAQFNFSENIKTPVKWEFSSIKINNSEFDLVFKGKIEAPWHIYAINIPVNGPLPTVVEYNSKNNFTLIGNLIEITKSKIEYEETFNMNVGTYSGEVNLHQRVKVLSNDTVVISGTISYQSCKEGMCIPDDNDFEISVKGSIAQKKQKPIVEKEMSSKVIKEDSTDIEVNDSIKNKAEVFSSNNDDFSNNKGSLLNLLLIAFGLGLASILTPCVYPIIPLTVSFFTGSSDNRKKTIFNAVVFGISITLIYTFIGFLIGVTKVDFTGKLAGNWIANLIFFSIFIIFAISFFGVFEIMLPNSIANKVDKRVDKGGFLAPFFMALATIIISFSCTGPIVTIVLGKAIDGQIITPTLSMFSYGLAFALPFSLLAFFPMFMKKIPKSGGWLNAIKVVFAFILLAFGLKFLSIVLQYFHIDVLNRDIFISLWIAIFTLMGFYLLGKIKFSHDSDLPFISVGRLFMAIFTFAFVAYLIPGLFGAPLKILSSFLPPKTTQEFNITSNEVNQSKSNSFSELCETPKYSDLFHFPSNLEGYFDYDEGMACAKKKHKPVLLDFKGHSCSNCKVMEANVWSDPDVIDLLNKEYIIISLYIDDRTKLLNDEWFDSKMSGKTIKTIGKKNNDLMLSHFKTNAIPYYVIVDNDGKVLVQPKNFDNNIEHFITFLEKGKKQYNLK